MSKNKQISEFLLSKLVPAMAKRGEVVEDIEEVREDETFVSSLQEGYSRHCREKGTLSLVEYIDQCTHRLPLFAVWTKKTVYFTCLQTTWDEPFEYAAEPVVGFVPRHPESKESLVDWTRK